MTFRLPPIFASFLLAALAPLQGQQVQMLNALPANSQPSQTIFQAADGYLYGLLTETNAPMSYAETEARGNGIGLPKTSGAVFRISPEGVLQYLHHFPYAFYGPWPDAVGHEAHMAPIMGRDGFLYGTTIDGGLNGTGVLYRLSTDGSLYEVVAHFPAAYHVREVYESPQGGFIAWDGVWGLEGLTQRLIRIGMDGTFTTIGEPLITSGFTTYQPSPESDRIAVVWSQYSDASNFTPPDFPPPPPGYEEPRGTLLPATSTDRRKVTNTHVRWIDLATGDTISETMYDVVVPRAFYGKWLLMTDTHFYVAYATYDPDLNTNLTGILAIDLATGESRKVFETAYDWMDYSLTRELAPLTLIAAGEDTFYYTTGYQTEGFFGFGAGTKLRRINADGTDTPLVDLNGWPICAAGLGRDGCLYGLSWGNTIELVGGDEPNLSSAVSARQTARAAIHPRHGAFRITPTNVSPALPPAANRDVLSQAGLKKIQAVTAAVLRNDRDPARGVLTLKSVSAAAHGQATVSTDAKGTLVVAYTPAALPARSELLSYEVENSAGVKATGQLAVRGQVAGVYRGESGATAAQSFLARVTAGGGYTVTARAGGQPIQVSGKLDFSDAGHAERKLSKTTQAAVQLRIEPVNGANRLSYEITVGGAQFSGTAAP